MVMRESLLRIVLKQLSGIDEDSTSRWAVKSLLLWTQMAFENRTFLFHLSFFICQ